MNRPDRQGEGKDGNLDARPDERLVELDARLSRLAPDEDTNVQSNGGQARGHESSAYGLASRVAADLIAGLGVCLFLAWGITELWWTQYRAPIMAFGGVASVGIGIYNVWRSANRHWNPPSE